MQEEEEEERAKVEIHSAVFADGQENERRGHELGASNSLSYCWI
jgi:hypothetical protein